MLEQKTYSLRDEIGNPFMNAGGSNIIASSSIREGRRKLQTKAPNGPVVRKSSTVQAVQGREHV